MLTRVLDVTGCRRGCVWPVVPEGDCVFFLLTGFGFARRGRKGAASVEGENFPIFFGGRFGQCGFAWAVRPKGDGVLLLLMEFNFAGRGRKGAASVEGENFLVFLIGSRFGRRGVSGAMSKWRKSFASLSVKYRVCPGGRVPRFSGPN